MNSSAKRWIIAVCLMNVPGIEARAQHQEFQLGASDGAANDYLGSSVALSGNLALVGARGGGSSGAAYVFDVTTGQQVYKFTALDGAAGESFGFSVALSGTIALIGAPQDDDLGASSGSAYVFDMTSGQQQFKLTASDGAALDSFGYSVALFGSVALIGAPDYAWRTDSGSVYMFDVATGQQLRKLTASDGDPGDRFGQSVALSGSRALVGAALDDGVGPYSGSAYLFDLTTGQELFKLTASDGATGDWFGQSVAVSKEIALVGAINNDDYDTPGGSAYVFDVTTGVQVFKLRAVDYVADDLFGQAVALSGNLALIGAYGRDALANRVGSAYVFDVTTGRQLHQLFAWPPEGDNDFGDAVALSGDRAVIGAPYDDDLGNNSGAAYVFSLQSVPYNVGCSGSGGITPYYAINGDVTAGSVITLEISDAVGGSVAFILQAFGRATVPMGADCTLNLAPPVAQINGPFILNPYFGSGPGIGWLNIPVAIPSTAPPGLSFTTQVFIPDAGVPRGYAGTNGLEVTFR